jgi:GNAT superfamily N-acetyltransferase
VTGTNGDALPRTIALDRWLGEAAADRVTPTTHGLICTSPSFPRRYDSNFLWVLDAGPEVRGEDLDAEVGEALPGFEHREIMVNDDASGARIAPDLAALGYDASRLVVMRHLREADHGSEVPVSTVSFAQGRPLFEESQRREPHVTDDELLRSLVDWRGRLEERVGARFFVGSVEGAQAGACELYLHDGVGMVEDVFTLPEYQGRGVARGVVGEAVRTAVADGADLVFLHTAADGWPRQLYAKLGFDPIGHVWSFLRSPTPIER